MNNQKQPEEERDKPIYSRRYFFEVIGLGAIGIAAAGSMLLTTQFLSPNTLREPALKFKAGSPEDYPPGSVTLNKEQKVFIVRAKEGYFYALSAVCTHLGCIVQWEKDKQDFLCPCHAGHYSADGVVTAGPPPKPLKKLPFTVAGGNITVG